MEGVKYIYFEVHWTSRRDVESEKEIKNENILLNKPHINSDGYWGFLNMTKRPGRLDAQTEHYIVSQYWIDLSKYQLSNSKTLNNAMETVKTKLSI